MEPCPGSCHVNILLGQNEPETSTTGGTNNPTPELPSEPLAPGSPRMSRDPRMPRDIGWRIPREDLSDMSSEEENDELVGLISPGKTPRRSRRQMIQKKRSKSSPGKVRVTRKRRKGQKEIQPGEETSPRTSPAPRERTQPEEGTSPRTSPAPRESGMEGETVNEEGNQALEQKIGIGSEEDREEEIFFLLTPLNHRSNKQ